MCSSWTAHTFGGSVELLQESQGCIRSIVVLGRAKRRHYSRIPWLLARLEEPGIAAECTRQFNAVPEASHKSVSKQFKAAGSRLRPMVDNIAPDGTGVCEELRSAIQSMRDISIDDSYAEGPHASMGRIMSAARSSKWARCSSTLRLDQNLQDVHRLCRALDLEVQAMWDTWSSVVKAPSSQSSSRLGRLTRKPRKAIERYIYSMDHTRAFDGDGAESGESEAEDPGDDGCDDGGGGGGAVAVRPGGATAAGRRSRHGQWTSRCQRRCSWRSWPKWRFWSKRLWRWHWIGSLP